jgi:hypothetical protein
MVSPTLIPNASIEQMNHQEVCVNKVKSLGSPVVMMEAIEKTTLHHENGSHNDADEVRRKCAAHREGGGIAGGRYNAGRLENDGTVACP